MKAKSMLFAGLTGMFSLMFAVASAQTEPAVKILPTNENGILKIMYAYETDRPVEIKFSNEGGILGTDKIKASQALHGFSKKYDARRITSSSFWVDVIASNVSVTYRVTKSKDGQSFVSSLEKATFSYPLVASKD